MSDDSDDPDIFNCIDCSDKIDLRMQSVVNSCELCDQLLCNDCGYKMIELYGNLKYPTICKECLEYHTSGAHYVYTPGCQEYGLHLSELPKFAANVAVPYKEQIKALETKIDYLQRMLDYQPGGPGAIAAKLSFDNVVQIANKRCFNR